MKFEELFKELEKVVEITSDNKIAVLISKQMI